MSFFTTKLQWLLLSGLLVILCSCDPVKYIAINNNEYARRVTVTYHPKGDIYWENDTLNAGPSGDTDFDTIIVRENIDSTSYTFIAPANRHIELMPKGKGQIIRTVTIEGVSKADSTLQINLTDKEELKRLSKAGLVQWYGPYSDLIIINKGNPPEVTTEEVTDVSK
jgi:hypothetical protein